MTTTTARLPEPLTLEYLPTSKAGRVLRYVRDMAAYGAAVASINYFSSSPTLLDPEPVWKFFTRRQPWPVEFFLDHYPVGPVRRRIIRRMIEDVRANGIEYHYDVSNDFYELFLDRQFMFYTCADFNSPTDTIEQAQLNKANHILGLLDPKPGEKILELGCGWGPMLRHVFATTGDKENLFGYTLSKEQKAYIDKNLGFNVECADFAQADLGEARFDKIYGIGCMEHIRPDEMLPLHRKLYRALKPGGRMVQHFFSLNGNDPMPTSMIGSQLFFPGALLSLHSYHLECYAKAGFRLSHDSLHNYCPTLRAWFDRLVENIDEAVRLVGIETTNKYLVYLATSWPMFHRKLATLHRLVLHKD
jgi:cyclopropane-fatty-acyl-phospholipid synthase